MVVNNRAQLVVVVQGLRDIPVAEKGRKVARIALVKSVTYATFLDETLKSGRKTATGGCMAGFVWRFAQIQGTSPP
jgi:hypothetical protein